MTATHEQTSTPSIPADLHEEARELIRRLASTAGDVDAAFAHVQDYCRPRRDDDALPGLAAALLVTFTECITYPVAAGEYAGVSLPGDDEGFGDE